MDTKKAIDLAGGQALVAKAITAKTGKETPRFTVHGWYKRNRLPDSEWTGTSAIAPIICDLAAALGHNIDPLDICPGAGQYMKQQERAAA